MSFYSELKTAIKADFTGASLSEDSDIVKIISKEITTILKEKYDQSPEYTVRKPEEAMVILPQEEVQVARLIDEIELRVKKQIRLELDRGKTRRIIFKLIELIFTLIAGGIIGALFQKYLQ